ncbi:hypothetical protein HHK36_003395 [Tetracentron sinense]|uniref:Major facilitator superfamily (MFS) profile domain-containing protein n=1 Tax=Tetracentron sinense TaxID=13715 RepID=A0A834ZTB1_TETSI|nr:hypothetical protein HHK36_003395 [Tetracentron sinense]
MVEPQREKFVESDPVLEAGQASPCHLSVSGVGVGDTEGPIVISELLEDCDSARAGLIVRQEGLVVEDSSMGQSLEAMLVGAVIGQGGLGVEEDVGVSSVDEENVTGREPSGARGWEAVEGEESQPAFSPSDQEELKLLTHLEEEILERVCRGQSSPRRVEVVSWRGSGDHSGGVAEEVLVSPIAYLGTGQTGTLEEGNWAESESCLAQETMVTMAIAGAIVGAAVGGWMIDRHGRRTSILVADLLSIAGAIIMAFAPVPMVMIIGRILMGLGVGMLSMLSPVYISEASPTRIRGALVGTNCLLYAVGILLFHLTNLAFPKAPGTWRWLVGFGGIPALVQFILMFSLPESPRWLYKQNREEEAMEILWKIYPPHEINTVVESLHALVTSEMANLRSMDENLALAHRAISSGLMYHLCQQFGALSIKLVLYCTTTAFASNKMVLLALPLITSGLGVVGSIVTITFVDRIGRKGMMFMSMCMTIFWQVVLYLAFAPFGNLPSGYTLVWVGAYIISYSTGLATVPWIVISEVSPLRDRGVCSGIAAVANWVMKLINPTCVDYILNGGDCDPVQAILFLIYPLFLFTVLTMGVAHDTKGLPLEEVEEVETMLIKVLEDKGRWPIESSRALRIWDSAHSGPCTCHAGGARLVDLSTPLIND